LLKEPFPDETPGSPRLLTQPQQPFNFGIDAAAVILVPDPQFLALLATDEEAMVANQHPICKVLFFIFVPIFLQTQGDRLDLDRQTRSPAVSGCTRHFFPFTQ
jgi:hypothetical protein